MWWHYLNISKRRAVKGTSSTVQIAISTVRVRVCFPAEMTLVLLEALLIPRPLNAQLSIALSPVLLFIEVQFLCSSLS